MALQQWYSVVLFVSLAGCSTHMSAPLWPGSKYSEADRTKAMLRALDFIKHSADNPRNFDLQDCDYLDCFYSIAATASDSELREEAARLAPKYAKQWAKTHATVPPEATAAQLTNLIFGWLPAALLGEDDSQIKPELQRAVARYKPVDFLLFDPAVEAPPTDLPEPCNFDRSYNPRGATTCQKCGRPLVMKTRYEVWLDALIVSYSGERYGVRMGGSFSDVLKWMPAMRPYPDRQKVNKDEFLDVVYALTHLVYTLNGYGQYKLPHDLLPLELAYLRQNLPAAIAMHDPETVGEFLDALKGLGLDNSDPVVRTGITYLLDTQRPDGTWGPAEEKDFYNLYHAAWTAIDGLKDCCWHGERLSFPEVRPLLETMRK